MLARDAGIPFAGAAVSVRGTIDRMRQPHSGVTVFSSVDFLVHLRGPDAAQAAALVAQFQQRCPVYGSLAVASGAVEVRHEVAPAPLGARPVPED